MLQDIRRAFIPISTARVAMNFPSKHSSQLHRFIDRQILSNYIPSSIGQGTKIQQRPRAIQVKVRSSFRIENVCHLIQTLKVWKRAETLWCGQYKRYKEELRTNAENSACRDNCIPRNRGLQKTKVIIVLSKLPSASVFTSMQKEQNHDTRTKRIGQSVQG